MPDVFYPYYNFPPHINTNWKKLWDLSTSYARAIKTLLLEELNHYYLGDGIKSERDIFPVLNLIHIYLELILKSVVIKQTGVPCLTHNLEDLLTSVQSYLPSWTLAQESKSFILWLNAENRSSEAFRYNFDKNNNEYFVYTEDNLEKGIYLSAVYSAFMDIDACATDLKRMLSLPA